MPRPPLPIGTWGRITRREPDTGQWVAKARFRDLDGTTRLVERSGRTGATAERLLVEAMRERATPSSDLITPETPVTRLWEAHLGELRSEGRSPRTLDRYEYAARYIAAGLGKVRIREATTQRLDGFIRTVHTQHGPSVAQSARIVLSGMFSLAVRFGAAQHNPVREVSTVRTVSKPARALTVPELRSILLAVRESSVILNPANKVTPTQTIAEYCAAADLADVVAMFAATGARIGEVLGIRWQDVDMETKSVQINGKVTRTKGAGMVRDEYLKSKAGERTLPLPGFAVDMLLRRQVNAPATATNAVFPARTGNWRDPSATSKQWRRVRDRMGFDWVTSHTFRKTLPTIIDSRGLSARVGADHLGHAQISMTQNVYMGRKASHSEVAGALDEMLGA